MKSIVILILFIIASVVTVQAQWVQLAGRSDHQCLAVYAGDDFVIAATHDSNIVRSTDQGLTWTPSNAGIIDSLYIYTLYGDGKSIYLSSNKGAYVSMNGGQNWQVLSTGASGSRNVYAYLRFGAYLFMTGDSGIFRSSDNGQSWNAVNTGLPSGTTVYSIVSNQQDLYIGTYRQGMLRSDDNGERWTLLGTGMPQYAVITSIWADGDHIVAFNKGNKWIVSTDRGATWTVNSGHFTNLVGAVYSVLTYPNIVICAADYGVIRSVDYGKAWDAFKLGPECHVTSLSVDNGYLYAATPEAWIWRRPLSEILPPASVEGAAAPYALRLDQNTPNPAVTGASVSYMLPSYAPVTMKLYNAMMQEVSTLVVGPQEAGEHTVIIDAGALSSGVYYYRLSTGTSSLTRQMVVVK